MTLRLPSLVVCRVATPSLDRAADHEVPARYNQGTSISVSPCLLLKSVDILRIPTYFIFCLDTLSLSLSSIVSRWSISKEETDMADFTANEPSCLAKRNGADREYQCGAQLPTRPALISTISIH